MAPDGVAFDNVILTRHTNMMLCLRENRVQGYIMWVKSHTTLLYSSTVLLQSSSSSPILSAARLRWKLRQFRASLQENTPP